MMTIEYDQIAKIFGQIALQAAVPIMEFFRSDVEARRKSDGSPVTDADLASEKIILAALKYHFPDIPVISEEAAENGHIPEIGNRFILVDPLDGTREFASRRREFAINIGLIDQGVARAGAIFAPALSKLWIGGENAHSVSIIPGADLTKAESFSPISTRLPSMGRFTIVASRSHLDQKTSEFIELFGNSDRVSAGSSLKFCLVAEGLADVYPRFGPTMEWDVAAGDAILRAAGGVLVVGDGRQFMYGKQGFHTGPFIALGKPDLLPAIFPGI
jgi:3'(2'),5'-bisphosphate nucleotidase